MKIFIKETKEIKSLNIVDENGIDWTEDLVEASKFWNDEAEQHEMSEGDYEWWAEYIRNYESDEQEMLDLADERDIDVSEIRDRISTEMNCDMEDEHSIKQGIFDAIRLECNKANA